MVNIHDSGSKFQQMFATGFYHVEYRKTRFVQCKHNIYIKLLATANWDCEINTALVCFIFSIITWPALWVGKMNQILRCDWLPEWARWSYLANSGLPFVSRKKNFPESHIINPLLTKLFQSRWLDTGLIHFFACSWTSTPSRSIKHAKKKTWPISGHLDLTLGQ